MPTSNISAIATSTSTVRAHSFGMNPPAIVPSANQMGHLFKTVQSRFAVCRYAARIPMVERDNAEERQRFERVRELLQRKTAELERLTDARIAAAVAPVVPRNSPLRKAS